MMNTKESAVSGPTPGCVISRSTSGHFLASRSTAAVNSWIVGFMRSSSSSRSWRRREAQVPSASFPAGLVLRAPQLLLPSLAFIHRQRLQLIHNPRAHLHQPMPMPQQLSQVTILRTGYPDPRKIIFPQQSQQQSGVLPVGLLFAHAFSLNLGRIADPQFHTEFCQQPLEPAGVARGLHPHSYARSSPRQFPIKLLGFSCTVVQLPFPILSCFCVYKRDVLIARVIIHAYNDHVGSFLSSQWSSTNHSVLGSKEPALLCNQVIGAAHEYQDSRIVQHVKEVDAGRHHTPEDHHQHSVVLVHSLEQPVKSQHEEDQDGPGEQVGDDAETEERLVRGNLVNRRGSVPTHKQSAGNIDEARSEERR